jgi:hypothetical protein
MSDLALVFINLDGHWLRVDRIESIHPVKETAYRIADDNACYVTMIGANSPRWFSCKPEHVLQEIGEALKLARNESPQDSGEPLDLDAMEEPVPPSTTRTRGGESWGRP